MYRGNHTNERGGNRGARGGPRGQPGRGRARGRGRGRGRGGPGYDLSTETDFIIQMYPDNSANRGGYASPGARGRGTGSPARGYDAPRARGRGRGDYSYGFDSSRGRGRGDYGFDAGRGRGRGDYGFDSGRGRGRGDYGYDSSRGRGRGGSKLRPDAPLSKLLYEERPLLRPIKFVRSVHHATLFQEEEELLQPVVEDVGDEEQSHVPTADRVMRVFSGGNFPRVENENENEEEEELEEIDFDDLAKLREEVDAAASVPGAAPVRVEAVEERFMGIFIDKRPPLSTGKDSPIPAAVTAPPPSDLFYTDTTPTMVFEEEPESAAPPPPSDMFYVDSAPTMLLHDKQESAAPTGEDSQMPSKDPFYVDGPPTMVLLSDKPESALPPPKPTAMHAASVSAPPNDIFYVDGPPTMILEDKAQSTSPLLKPTVVPAAAVAAPPNDLFYVDSAPTMVLEDKAGSAPSPPKQNAIPAATVHAAVAETPPNFYVDRAPTMVLEAESAPPPPKPTSVPAAAAASPTNDPFYVDGPPTMLFEDKLESALPPPPRQTAIPAATVHAAVAETPPNDIFYVDSAPTMVLEEEPQSAPPPPSMSTVQDSPMPPPMAETPLKDLFYVDTSPAMVLEDEQESAAPPKDIFYVDTAPALVLQDLPKSAAPPPRSTRLDSPMPTPVVAETPSNDVFYVDSTPTMVLHEDKPAPPKDIFYVDTAPTLVLEDDQPEPAASLLPPNHMFYVDTTPTLVLEDEAESAAPPKDIFYVDSAPTMALPESGANTLFYVDTTPTPVAGGTRDTASALARLHAHPAEDDEEIVYVAPHPRSGRASATFPEPLPVSPPSFSSNSVLTGTAIAPVPAFTSVAFAFSPSPKKPRAQVPVFTVHGQTKARTKARGLARRVERRTAGPSAFGARGARAAEARLRGDDPRREEQRRGDSDVDWGDEDGDEGPEEEDGGMDVDVELDVEAMRRFAGGMSAEGGRFVTMDDIHDAERIRREDEDAAGGGVGSSDEEDETSGDEEADAIVEAEEGLMVAEPRDLPSDDNDDESEDDSDEQSPRSGFQARLERLRKAARERGADDSLEFMEGDSSDEDFLQGTWADRDDDFATQIQAFLDENGDILSARSNRGRNQLLEAVKKGQISDFEGFAPAKRGKNKRNDLPEELQAVWDKDREKKAENKRLRALARAEAAADPLMQNKGGKKGRKAMLAAAKLDPTITVIPNRVIDMTTLVQQIRRFTADLGGPATMSLPPTDKTTRKNIHEMAIAFNLKSVSKGKGDARYTTLSKTTRSGYWVDEAKVAKIARRGGAGAAFVKYDAGDKGKARAAAMPRHRDGDEVGKAAPKIGESNIGFKMLASMGWTEGERIGVSAGGLHIPLTAVIKNTKLGLGATR
ncbi:hypothetical protein B0H17DRAFT_194764 [Mycena rosella]|uniref:Protein SQS1 n=1 Tax=Mycena rosella TaxID=1033263 RepID=A0AAD7CZK5_MYCRO|nr:hypothetical protein B0H17DRAFT_194764 [Mycena rosella]